MGATTPGAEAPEGVLVLDKPAGPTSHDAVDRARRALGVRRVGHAGTLDPFATGVLPVCVGRATRLVRFLADSDKEYRAEVCLGFATDTDDRTGTPLGEPRPVAVDRAGAEAACRGLTGRILQVPPAYSAKRRGGERLYSLARRGVAVERTPVPVTVHELEVLGLDGATLELRVRCAAGTYVRALARDLGERLGTGAHLAALRRTRVGGFDLAQAVDWEEPEAWAGQLVPLAELLPELPAVRVGEAGARAVRHGRDLRRDQVEEGFPEAPAPAVRVLDARGRLLAVAVCRGFDGPRPGLPSEPALHPDVVLAG